MIVDQGAYEAHAFEYDASTIDKPLVEFLQRFYTFSDDRENAIEWAKCFTDDAMMEKGNTNVKGRDEIARVNEGSWAGQASRQHIVFKVFAYEAGKPTEVMVYGLSKYVFENGSKGEMPWAARLELERYGDGKILIKLYNIYPVVPVKIL